jgi:hypothetical protein
LPSVSKPDKANMGQYNDYSTLFGADSGSDKK